MDMRNWDDLVARIASIQHPDDSLLALLNALAAMIDDMAARPANNDDLSDVAWALRAKTEALVDAIVHKPLPRSIALPDRSGEDWCED